MFSSAGACVCVWGGGGGGGDTYNYYRRAKVYWRDALSCLMMSYMHPLGK